MSRAPAFDRETVLERAAATFWRGGYAGTSVDDLVEATGLGRGSLYAAFGSKRGLFDASLEHYAATVSAPLFAPLSEPDADFGAIEIVLRRLATPNSEAPAAGCMITNAACENDARDRDFRELVRTALSRVEARFEAALERACARGQLAANVEPSDAALFLLGVAQGLRVLGRLGESRDRLNQLAETALCALRAQSTSMESH